MRNLHDIPPEINIKENYNCTFPYTNEAVSENFQPVINRIQWRVGNNILNTVTHDTFGTTTRTFTVRFNGELI